MADYVGAIDQGTSSSRFIIFDTDGNIVSVGQREHEQIHPRPGWVAHNPVESRTRVREVISHALGAPDVTPGEIRAIGITNQRETTVMWDRNTGEPVYNAIVWQDTRTARLGGGVRRGRRGWSRSAAATSAQTACGESPGCRCRRTSPGRRRGGSSTTWTACANV